MKAVQNRGEKEFKRAIKMLNGQGDTWAFDVETTGLNVRKDTIIGFGISNGLKGFYFCHKYWEEGKLKEALSKEDCLEILSLLKDKQLAMWNGSFDCRITENYFGIDLVPSLWMDGMLGKHQIAEERPFALKDVGVLIYGEQERREQLDLIQSIKDNGGESKEYYKADLDIMAKYCIQDCHLTFRLCHNFLTKMEKENLTHFFFHEETMPLYKNVTIPMEKRGIPVNVPLIEQLQIDIQKDIDKLEQKIQSLISPLLDKHFVPWYYGKAYPPKRSGKFAQAVCRYYNLPLPKTSSGAFSLSGKALESVSGPAVDWLKGKDVEIDILEIQKTMGKVEFNLSSKRHLSHLFFDTLHEKPLSSTPKGTAQVNDVFIKEMASKYEWAADLRDLNKLHKIKSAYIDRILREQEDGIFYPSFFQHRTISGRYGSDLQQLPRPLEEGQSSKLVRRYNNEIRKFFIAGENYVFIDSDYESLEPHVFAHVSGDKRLKDIFRSGRDFYSTIAIDTEKLTGISAVKTDENYLGRVDGLRRQRAKAYALGIPYGMNAFALGKTLGVSTTSARQLIDAYLDAYPKLADWMELTNYNALEFGKIESEAGRVRHFEKLQVAYKNGVRIDRNYLKKYEYKSATYNKMAEASNKMKNWLNNAKNFQIQSLAASITNRACIAIAKELKKENVNGYVCAQIHDQIIVRVPKNVANIWQKKVQHLMENTYKLSIPLKAPAAIATDFYEGH